MRYLAVLLALFLVVPAHAQQSRVPPVETYKAMLDASKDQGWVAFREIDGKQFIYFTPLVSMRCGLEEVRYSINSDALDQNFELIDCIPANPFALPSDAPIGATLITLAPGEAKAVAVQAVFKDGTESEVMFYEPCEGVGDGTCAFPIQ